MIPTSNPQSAALVPINRQSVSQGITLESRFNDSSRTLYSKHSPYDAGDGGFAIGFQQPYVWTGLNDSNLKKYLKRYDNTTFPIGSTVHDVLRIGKFMASGTGLKFSGIQFLLQTQNAFNETRIWNPLSVITATSKKGLLGLIDRPTRHIETSQGGIFNTILDGFKSSVGMQTSVVLEKSPPQGTARLGLAGLSLEAKSGLGWPSKGFIRHIAAKAGRDRFMAKFPSGGTTPKGNSAPSNFLKSLGQSIVSRVTSLIPTTKGAAADWDIRPEYSDTVDVYSSFFSDKQPRADGLGGLLSYQIKGQNYEVTDVLFFGPSHGTVDTKEFWYFSLDAQRRVKENISPLKTLAQELADGDFDPTKNIHAKQLGQPANINSTVTKRVVSDPGGNGVLDESTMNKIRAAVGTWNNNSVYGTSNYTYDRITEEFFTSGYKTYSGIPNDADISDKKYGRATNDSVNRLDLSKGKKFGGAGRSDEYNRLKPILSERFEFPEELMDDSKGSSRDLIYFYFYDIVNGVYIPFRATITGLAENTGVDWEDFQYIGRADRLYLYKGFTREVNFQFTVYAGSVTELQPMWSRINYLSGLTRPAKYTNDPNSVGLGNFIYPPMVMFRIGDLFVDQPAIIRSFGLTVPDDSPWELTRSNSKWNYKNKTVTSNTNTAQLPMKVDVIVSMALMEKKRAETDSIRYFDDVIKGFDLPGNRPVRSREFIDRKLTLANDVQPAPNGIGFSPDRRFDDRESTRQRREEVFPGGV